MRTCRFFALFCLVFVSFAAVVVIPAMALAGEPYKVLVVMSYEEDNPWCKEIREGIESVLSTSAELEYFYTHLEQVLTDIRFLNPENPRHLMRRLRRLFVRAGLDQNELNILRGVLTAVETSAGKDD